MEIKLEELEYQQMAINSVVNVFEGNNKNTFDNACTEGIRSNVCTISKEKLEENIKSDFTLAWDLVLQSSEIISTPTPIFLTNHKE